MFRSENNVLACTDLPQGSRQRHDFLDDLESFLWVYVWIIMIHNGPGEAALFSDPCVFIDQLLPTTDLPHLHGVKYLFMRNLIGHDRAHATPYFAQTPYLELLDNLRNLCEEYRHPKQRGEDLFPQMEGIYHRYLAHFDTAIEQLGGTINPMDMPSFGDADLPLAQHGQKLPLPLPPRRNQPDRRAKRTLEDVVATRVTKKPRVSHPPPARSIKHFRDDDLVTTREPKKRKIPRPSANTHARKEDVKASTAKAAGRPHEGTRRSERIRKGKAKDALTGANGVRRTTGSRKA